MLNDKANTHKKIEMHKNDSNLKDPPYMFDTWKKEQTTRAAERCLWFSDLSEAFLHKNIHVLYQRKAAFKLKRHKHSSIHTWMLDSHSVTEEPTFRFKVLYKSGYS